MRRRWHIAISSVIALCAIALIAFILAHAHGQFRFLSGRKPLPGSTSKAYVFEAPKESFLKAAKAELIERGCTIQENTSDGSAIKADSDLYGVIDVFVDEKEVCTSDGNLCVMEENHPGWVTVIFWGQPPTSLWDEIAAKLGL